MELRPQEGATLPPRQNKIANPDGTPTDEWYSVFQLDKEKNKQDELFMLEVHQAEKESEIDDLKALIAAQDAAIQDALDTANAAAAADIFSSRRKTFFKF